MGSPRRLDPVWPSVDIDPPMSGLFLSAAVADNDPGTAQTAAIVASAASASTFDIVVRYSGDPRYLPVFEAAAQRWEQIVTGDLPDVVSVAYGQVDDLLIDASVSRIDGAGSILAESAPDEFRGAIGGSLPFHGYMHFDTADIEQLFNQGTLLSIVLHEMAHVLGFGTIWNGLHLLNGLSYIGANALVEYRALTGNPSATGISLENQGAPARPRKPLAGIGVRYRADDQHRRTRRRLYPTQPHDGRIDRRSWLRGQFGGGGPLFPPGSPRQRVRPGLLPRPLP
jgi:hypothetical protein